MLDAVTEAAYRKCTHLNLRRYEECATLIDWLAPQATDRILDIGCGDGFWSRRMAKTGAEIVGIDLSERGIATANQKNTTERITYHYMNAEEMPFEDKSFDKVISLCVIEHFVNEDRVLEHVGRVLKPGGQLVISADSLSNPEITEKERTSHRKRYAVNTFYTLDLLEQKLARVGLEIEQHKFILTHPLTLAMVRATWKLDDAPKWLAPVTEPLYFGFNTVGRGLAALAEKIGGRKDTGLTLLARARKRA